MPKQVHRRDDALILTGGRRELVRYLVSSATLAAVGIWMGISGESLGLLVALAFGALALQFARMFRAGPPRLRLSSDGFRLGQHLVRWDNIDPPFIVEETLPLLTFMPFLAPRHRVTYSLLRPLTTEDEEFAQGFFDNAHALPDNYGMSADDLAELLNAWQCSPGRTHPA